MSLGRRERIMVVVLGVLLFGAGGYLGADWYIKDLHKLQALKTEKAADLAIVEEKVRDLAAVEQRLIDAQKLEEDYERLIPDSEELPQLLRDTSAMLQTAGVELTGFKPGKTSSVTLVPELDQKPVDVSVTGTYTQVIRMFETLHSAKRLIGIGSFTIKQESARGGVVAKDVGLTCQFNMIVFFARKAGDIQTGTTTTS